jgi:hypothetical protein
MNQGAKRARTNEPSASVNQAAGHSAGRPQLLLVKTEHQSWLGKKYCDEAELLPLLIAHSIVRRVRTIEVEVRPLGGDSFKISLDVRRPLVSEAKAEIARAQGTREGKQELYKVATRADGGAVREDDAEPELLDDEDMELTDGEIVAMAVKEMPLVWRAFPEDFITLSEGGAVVTHTGGDHGLVTTAETELTEGKHYWEVELLSKNTAALYIGISRPNVGNERSEIIHEDSDEEDSSDVWLICAYHGGFFGNGKVTCDPAGPYKRGDRVGVLLDLNNGSLRFFKNGVQHGAGYPAGSVTGPVVHAVQLYEKGQSVRLLSNAEAPAGV